MTSTEFQFDLDGVRYSMTAAYHNRICKSVADQETDVADAVDAYADRMIEWETGDPNCYSLDLDSLAEWITEKAEVWR